MLNPYVLEARAADDGPIARWRAWWQQEAGPAADRRGFVLTATELAAMGVTRAQVRTAIRRGRWVPAGRGLVAPIDVSRDLPLIGAAHVLERRRHALVAAGTARRRPADLVAGRSAAIQHGLPTLRIPATPELLTRDAGGGVRRAAHVFTARVPAEESTSWFGCPVTTVARTLVDLGRHDRFDAIMAADAALRERVTTARAVDRALATARGWPGVRRARDVLTLADPRAESPLESITRLRMHDDGLPPPEPQFWIGPYRVDFYWPRWRVVLEADGRVKYTSEERWEEKKREQALRRHGVERIERVTMVDVLGGWPATSHLLRSILV